MLTAALKIFRITVALKIFAPVPKISKFNITSLSSSFRYDQQIDKFAKWFGKMSATVNNCPSRNPGKIRDKDSVKLYHDR